MALYLIEFWGGVHLVRAANGHKAQEIAGVTGDVKRVTEAGPDGVLATFEIDGDQIAIDGPPDTTGDQDDPDC